MGKDRRRIAAELFDVAERNRRLAYANTRSEAKALERARAAGEAVEVSRGYYARASSATGMPARALSLWLVRAMSARHPDWVFSSFSAALVHGLQVSQNLLNEVHLAMDEHGNRLIRDPVIKCHVVRTLEFDLVDGIRVTPLAQTLLDCLCQADFARGLAIADSALHWGLIDEARLRGYVKRFGFRRRGVQTARKVVRWMDGRSENGGESMARAVMIDLGFELPELQVEIEDPMEPGRICRVDFYWKLPDGRVVIGELDGKCKYVLEGAQGLAPAIERLSHERRREAHINLTGAKVLRFSFSEAMDASYMRCLLASAGVPRRS